MRHLSRSFMQPAPTHLRSVTPGEGLTAAVVTERHLVVPPAAVPSPSLRWVECLTGFVVLICWMLLFGGGILVDTEPYRIAISPSGAAALAAGDTASPAAPVVAPAGDRPSLLVSWLVVLCCFLPLNLAWLCVASSTLGAFGNLANLGDDVMATRSRDTTNPYVSSVLRGFFVYLFMMSGLLLLDDAPFSDAGPG